MGGVVAVEDDVLAQLVNYIWQAMYNDCSGRRRRSRNASLGQVAPHGASAVAGGGSAPLIASYGDG
jgi:hypothetical protein